jgi:translation initiation factor 1
MSDLFTLEEGIYSTPVHIRKTQRNARKCFTIIEGLAEDLDLKKICKYLTKKNQCSGTILVDEKFGQVIKLTGDKRKEVKEFLIKEDICKTEQIHIHG